MIHIDNESLNNHGDGIMTIILDEWEDASGRWIKYSGQCPLPITANGYLVFEVPSSTAA